MSEAERFGGRVRFVEGNVFTLIDKHPALQSGTVDFVFHRLLVAGLPSYHAYLRQVVYPLLKPGGSVEMHDSVGLRWYQSDPDRPGSATCVSDDWLWTTTFESVLRHRGHRDRLDAGYLTLQILDFEDIGHKLYRLP